MKRLWMNGIRVLFISALVTVFSSCEDNLLTNDQNITEDLQLKDANLLKRVPFTAHYTTYPVIIGEIDGNLIVDIPSEGNASHLGVSTWNSLSTVYTSVAPPWNQDGTMVFESKSTGDQLIGHFKGTSEPLVTNPFQGWGEYEITSGTGKFKDARGRGTYNYIVSPEMVGDLKFSGILTIPK